MTHRTRRLSLLSAAAVTTLALAACGGGFEEEPGEPGASGADELSTSEDSLTLLMGSSGDPETNAVKEQVATWSKSAGVDVEVVLANDPPQQLAQGFAAGTPADIFYLTSDVLAGFADAGSLEPYGSRLENKDDFYPNLLDTFTVDDQLYCAPKDFGSLALVIDEAAWAEAGLTDDDIPTTWEELTKAAKALTTEDRVGLAFGSQYNQTGVFFEQAGGGLIGDDGQVTADSPENLKALEYLAKNMNDGVFDHYTAIGGTWGGDSIGTGLAAMVIEGPWITGAMEKDYPDLKYRVVELPAGPGGQGTHQFTTCWGMAADSPNQQAVLELVQYLTTPEVQLAFADAFGPIPSVRSAGPDWEQSNPKLAAFLSGADYATSLPNMDGAGAVISDFDAQLESLKTGDAKAMLTSVQQNLEAIVK